MKKNDLKNYGEQDLINLSTFWRRLINELEIKKPGDVLPEMRQALAETETCLKDLAAISDKK